MDDVLTVERIKPNLHKDNSKACVFNNYHNISTIIYYCEE